MRESGVRQVRLEAVEAHDLVDDAARGPFGTAAVIADDVDDQRVLELPELVNGVDEAADLVVGVLEEIGVVLDESRVEPLLLGRGVVPGGKLLRALGPLRARGDHAEFELALVGLALVFVPPHVELARVPAAPVERRLVRRMGGAGGEIGEDRPVRRDRLLFADPADAVVGQVARELVALFGRLVRFHRRRAAVERREELVGLAPDEPVEIVEAHVGRPVVERPGGGGLVVGDVVVLAEPGRGVAVLVQNLGDGGGAVGDEPAVPGIAAGNFLDDAGADAVVVAPGEQRGAGR